MRWVKELYCLRKIRKLERLKNEKYRESDSVGNRISLINHDIIGHYRKNNTKKRISINEILDDDEPIIIELKMAMLLEYEKLNRIDEELKAIREEIYDCRRFLGVNN